MTQGAILRNPRTKYKRSKNIFTVTTIALTQLWTRVFAIVTASCEVSNRESRTLPGRLRTAEIPTPDILAPDAANMRPALEQAAESKRRALENYFSERIYYMFLISKCAQLCYLRLENHSVMAKSDFSCVETYFFSGSFAGSSMCSNVRQVPCIPPQRSRLGLQNLGDTCYLQCLAHCSVLNPGQQV